MGTVPEMSRILIVDDEPANRELLQEILAAEGYAVEAAASGPDALGRARGDPPDLVVLDVTMPDMDGFEVCRHLKADAYTAHVPVLIVTGLEGTGDKERGIAAGADDYLTKPIDPQDLRTRVRSLLRVRHLSQELDRTLAYLQELEVARQATTPTAPGGGALRPSATRRGAHVLVVDDDRTIRHLYTGVLEGVGYKVTAVGGAAHAYEAATGDVDVVLLDLMMPGVSGLEALERLRQIVPEVPIVIVTAYQSVQNAIAALRGGAFDFVIKGMKPDVLLKSVARAVEGRRLALENQRLLEELRRRAGVTPTPPPGTGRGRRAIVAKD